MQTLLPAALVMMLASAAAAQPAVNGDLSDWSGVAPLATDPTGDSTGPIDVTALRVQSRGTRLFVQVDLATALNLSSGPAANTTLRLVVTRSTRTLTIDFRNRRAYLDGSTANTVTWPSISFSSLPTVSATRFEMEVETSVIGAAQGSTLGLNFSGADVLAAGASVTLNDPPAPAPVRRDPARPACANFRIASLNTFIDGLEDPVRRDRFVRLLDSVNADVYVFQEEYNTVQADAQAVINLADPLDDGAAWNVVKAGEFVIATPHPMTAVSLGTAHQAAIVRPAGRDPVLVINTHLKCCGYIASSEDTQRISQASGAIASFNAFRAGTLSPALAGDKDVPAIILGDWNLVGSSTPYDLWLASPNPGFSAVPIPHLIGDETWTWAAPSGLGFWPGILDLAAYDAARMRLVRAFSLDTAELSAGELAALGAQSGDSTASDHRLIVVDLSTGPSPDLNADGAVSTPDLTLFLGRFGQSAPPGSEPARADFNRDLIVDTADLVTFLGRFGTTCP